MGHRPCRGVFLLRQGYGGQVGERRPTIFIRVFRAIRC